MNKSELNSLIADLKLILYEPRVYCNQYFEDLINQLDIQTTKFEIEERKINIEDSKSANENMKKLIDDAKKWSYCIVEQLEQAKSKLLTKISSENNPNLNKIVQVENIIKKFETEFELLSKDTRTINFIS